MKKLRYTLIIALGFVWGLVACSEEAVVAPKIQTKTDMLINNWRYERLEIVEKGTNKVKTLVYEWGRNIPILLTPTSTLYTSHSDDNLFFLTNKTVIERYDDYSNIGTWDYDEKNGIITIKRRYISPQNEPYFSKKIVTLKVLNITAEKVQCISTDFESDSVIEVIKNDGFLKSNEDLMITLTLVDQ